METSNEQTKQYKSQINSSFKINPHLNHKINTEIDYFIAETDDEKVASAKTAQTVHIEQYIYRNWVLQRHIFIAV